MGLENKWVLNLKRNSLSWDLIQARFYFCYPLTRGAESTEEVEWAKGMESKVDAIRKEGTESTEEGTRGNKGGYGRQGKHRGHGGGPKEQGKYDKL